MTSNTIYHYVYRITNIVEKKHYYGKRSSKIEPKLDIGKKYFSSSRDKEFMLDQKRNPQNYKYKVVSKFSTSKETLVREIKLHSKFDVKNHLQFYNRANQKSDGFDATGLKHTIETRLKLSEVHKGKTASEETKTKMSESHKGQIRSPESRAKISLGNKGRKYSAEQNAKNSERQRGRITSEETKAKLSAAQKCRIYSAEENAKKSERKRLFYYISPIGIVDNATGFTPNISATAILHWCNNPDKIISKNSYSSSKYLYTNYLMEEIVEKTFGELGFYKIEKELFCLFDQTLLNASAST